MTNETLDENCSAFSFQKYVNRIINKKLFSNFTSYLKCETLTLTFK